MPYIVDFENVSAVGLESSPVAQALAGLRANEARYYKNKYDHVFTVSPASEAPETLDWVNRILAHERDIVISAPASPAPLAALARLAAPPPAPRPPRPPALECLRRDNTMITTNYSCRICSTAES